MKTTIEIPDRLLREAKAERPWMKHFGALKQHAAELQRVERIIAAEFKQVDPRSW